MLPPGLTPLQTLYLPHSCREKRRLTGELPLNAPGHSQVADHACRFTWAAWHHFQSWISLSKGSERGGQIRCSPHTPTERPKTAGGKGNLTSQSISPPSPTAGAEGGNQEPTLPTPEGGLVTHLDSVLFKWPQESEAAGDRAVRAADVHSVKETPVRTKKEVSAMQGPRATAGFQKNFQTKKIEQKKKCRTKLHYFSQTSKASGARSSECGSPFTIEANI